MKDAGTNTATFANTVSQQVFPTSLPADPVFFFFFFCFVFFFFFVLFVFLLIEKRFTGRISY